MAHLWCNEQLSVYGHFVQMERFSRLICADEKEKWSTSEGRPFVSGNSRLVLVSGLFVFQLKLNRKIYFLNVLVFRLLTELMATV